MWKNTFFHDRGIWGVGEARLPVCRVLVLTHNFEVWRPVIVWLLVFAIIGLWLQSWQWQNCKSKQAGGSFDSKPILFVIATIIWGNRKYISLSDTFKAKARFRVKTKIRPEVAISEQFQPNFTNVEKYLFSRLWKLRGGWRTVASVRGSCFNSQFWGLETSCSSVVSVLRLRVVVTERAVAKL